MRSRIWDYEKNQTCDDAKAEEYNKRSLELLEEAMLRGPADLHTHTNVSDGKTSPPQLIQEVMRCRLKTFALTDHDTIAGIEAISMVFEKLSQLNAELPDFVPGVEISARFEGQEVHLLAYYPAGLIRCLEGYLEERRKDRDRRNKKLCEKANENGMRISFEELSNEGGFVVGRLHMAQLMIRKGYVTSVQEAFDTWLSEGRPCYVERELPDVEEAIKEVRRSGGVPVLAHPALYKDWLRGEEAAGFDGLRDKLTKLKDEGLQGVEVLHGETALEESRLIAEAGAELDLLPTAGSDYHGSHKPHVRLRSYKDDHRSFLAEFYPQFAKALQEER